MLPENPHRSLSRYAAVQKKRRLPGIAFELASDAGKLTLKIEDGRVHIRQNDALICVDGEDFFAALTAFSNSLP